MFNSGEAPLRDMIPLRDNTLPDPKKARFGEPYKFLPVAFVLCIISSLWTVYVFGHCSPLMAREETYMHGWSNLVVFNLITALLLTCYFRSVMQHPGTIPDATTSADGEVVSWEYAPQDGRAAQRAAPAAVSTSTKEKKRLGDRRNCKWCNKYKPDRCHHCRVCRMCILKMDHHCPWIYNCVGFKNFKYFFLLVVYAAAASHMIVWTMVGTVRSAMHDPTMPFLSVFAILFGQTLAGLFGFLLSVFLCFHIFLMTRSMTTIEFCEKSRRTGFSNDSYSHGLIANLKASLGDNILLWPFPICLPSGDGVNFGKVDDFDILSDDAGFYQVDRRKAHERTAMYGSMAASAKPGRSKQKNCGGTGEAPMSGHSGNESGSSESGSNQAGEPGDPQGSTPDHDVRVVVSGE